MRPKFLLHSTTIPTGTTGGGGRKRREEEDLCRFFLGVFCLPAAAARRRAHGARQTGGPSQAA
eukprot:3258150-Pyramimonas_sp.AAC.1